MINNIKYLYRDNSDFKVYQPRTNVVKDEKDDIVANCHIIRTRWRKHFSQLQSVRGANDVRQTEIRTAEPLVSERSAFEVEMATERLKRCISPSVD